MARTGRPVRPIELTEEERLRLEALTRKQSAQVKEVQRARMILLASKDLSNKQIAGQLAVKQHTVGHWRRRYAGGGFAALSEAPCSGRPRTMSDEKVAEVVRSILEEKPPVATHWSTRKLARATAISPSTVGRIWRAFKLQPHRHESFTLSKDPYFVEKIHDVVGLYMAPRENALVFCIDEKSQIQALERSQPILSRRPGAPERQTHDYFRHGTISLFAALDVATGQVISSLKARHRNVEFLAFFAPDRARSATRSRRAPHRR